MTSNFGGNRRENPVLQVQSCAMSISEIDVWAFCLRGKGGHECEHCEHSAGYPSGRALDSPKGRSYMAAIPFHRLTGGAFVRAPFFHWSGSNALRWDGRVPAVLWS